MPGSEPLTAGKPELHALVEAKLVKVFGPDRGQALLRSLLGQLHIAEISGEAELLRVAELLQTRPGFEGTVGAMLAVTAAVRRSHTTDSRPRG